MKTKCIFLALFILTLLSCQDELVNSDNPDFTKKDDYAYVLRNAKGYSVQTDTIASKCFSAKAVLNGELYYPFTVYNYCDTMWSYRFNDSITHTFSPRYNRYSKSWKGRVEKSRHLDSDSINMKLWLPELPSPGVEAGISVVRLGPGLDSLVVYRDRFSSNEVDISFLKTKASLDSIVLLFEFRYKYMDLFMEALPAKFAFVQGAEKDQDSLMIRP